MTQASFKAFDYQMMARAIRLAEQGLYTTDPNPRVGCVLTQGENVVGEGWHAWAGEAHAEVKALNAAGDQAHGATAYVSLEPCSHHGRTPPCCDALIAAGVQRVVVAMQDPNPEVSGRGLERMRAAGIEVNCGLLEAEAEALNPGFIKRMRAQRPFVRCKLAMSLDGRTAMASGESQWITGAGARADVQQWRARASAVVTGIGSIELDDSSLTVRTDELKVDHPEQAAKKQPLRVVLDSKLSIDAKARVLRQEDAPSLIVSLEGETPSAAQQDSGAEFISLPAHAGRIDLNALMSELAARECNEVLLECGATLAGAALKAGIIDELLIYTAPILLGSEARPLFELPLSEMAEKLELEIIDICVLGKDWRISAKLAPMNRREGK